MKTKVKNLLFISLVFCTLISCNKKGINSDEIIAKTDTVVNNEHSQNTTTENKIVNVELEKKIANNLKMLSGIWGEEGENAAWIIKGDTLQYFEDMENQNYDEFYKITYKNALLTILYNKNETLTQYKVIKLTNDSLIIQALKGNIIRMNKFGDVTWNISGSHKE